MNSACDAGQLSMNTMARFTKAGIESAVQNLEFVFSTSIRDRT